MKYALFGWRRWYRHWAFDEWANMSMRVARFVDQVKR